MCMRKCNRTPFMRVVQGKSKIGSSCLVILLYEVHTMEGWDGLTLQRQVSQPLVRVNTIPSLCLLHVGTTNDVCTKGGTVIILNNHCTHRRRVLFSPGGGAGYIYRYW